MSGIDAAISGCAALIVFGIGALFLLPSLWLLFRVFKADLPGVAEVAPDER